MRGGDIGLQDCLEKKGMQSNAANEQCKFNTGGNRFQFVSPLNFDEQFKTCGGKGSLGRFRLQGSYCNGTHVARSPTQSTIIDPVNDPRIDVMVSSGQVHHFWQWRLQGRGIHPLSEEQRSLHPHQSLKSDFYRNQP